LNAEFAARVIDTHLRLVTRQAPMIVVSLVCD
jgi:hypothetical protein